MSFMDKLKFWKKEEDKFAELDAQLGTLQTTSTTIPGTEPQPMGLESSNYADMDEIMRSRNIGIEPDSQETGGTGFTGFSGEHPGEKRRPSSPMAQQSYEIVQPQSAQQNQGMQQQQLELISAKLDTIRVSLESVNHRLVALERAMQVQDYEETETPRRRRGVW